MKVERLELKNFRNYEYQSIDFGEGINILYGENAQGKTNVLEALYITATGKSQRTNNYQDMIRKGAEGLRFPLRLLSGRDKSYRYPVFPGKRKACRNKRDKEKQDFHILGTMNMIFFLLKHWK